MVYFSIRCDPLPGKEEELDTLLRNKAKAFWTGQPGVKEYHVYGDKLMGWPERTIMIGIQDLSAFQKILDTEDRRKLRREFFTLVSRTESQIQDVIV